MQYRLSYFTFPCLLIFPNLFTRLIQIPLISRPLPLYLGPVTTSLVFEVKSFIIRKTQHFFSSLCHLSKPYHALSKRNPPSLP